jgi:hypothetical protein
VGRDDPGDAAAIPGPNAVTLPPGRRRGRPDATGSADRAGGQGLLLRVDPVRNRPPLRWAQPERWSLSFATR